MSEETRGRGRKPSEKSQRERKAVLDALRKHGTLTTAEVSIETGIPMSDALFALRWAEKQEYVYRATKGDINYVGRSHVILWAIDRTAMNNARLRQKL